MSEQKRGDDAGDHAPKPLQQDHAEPQQTKKQDAPNYRDRKKTEDGKAIKLEDVSSANDEGAN